MHDNAHRHAAAVGAGKLLRKDDRIPIVRVRAAILFGIVQPQKAQITHLLEEVMGRKDARLLPLIHMGIDLFFYECAHALAKHLVFFGKVHWAVVHGWEPPLAKRFGERWKLMIPSGLRPSPRRRASRRSLQARF